MRRRFGRRRKRTGRGEVLEQAFNALGNVRRRYGRSRGRRGRGRAYGDAVGLGIGVLAMVLTLLVLFWLVRRLTRETAPATPAEEAGVGEDAPPEETV